MKKLFISFAEKLIAVSIIFTLHSKAAMASSGIFETYIIVQANGGSANYYDLYASTTNPDFQGYNFGTFSCTNTLVIKGGQNKTYKNGTDDILNGYLYYKVYKNGTDPNTVSFTSINLAFDINLSNPGDQQWTTSTANNNVLQGLADGTYTVEVYSSADFTYNGGSGTHYQNVGGANYKATFTISNPMSIITNPTTPTVCYGSNTTLSAAATGNDAFIWQKQNGASWTNVSSGSLASSATTTLNLTNVTTTEVYRCLFTNCGGINTLSTQTVTVTSQRPTISLQPISQSDCDGNVVDFNITVSAGNTFTWQRKKPTDASFLAVTATTNSVITNTTTTSQLKVRNIGNTENPHLSQYQCIITDVNSCTNTTNVTTLSVNSIGNIADSPTICERGTTSFTTTLVGTSTAIKWQKGTSETAASSYVDLTDNSPNILGSATTTLSLANIPLTDNNTFYRVRATFTTVTNSGSGTCTQTQSVTAAITGKLTVIAAPTAPTANNASRCDVGTVTLSATSTLGANESFRWYDSNVSTTVLGTNATYTTASLAVGTYTYYLSVYNSSTTCESTRTPVTVTVKPLPTITLSSVADICNSASAFNLPFSSTTNAPNQYSISLGSPALSGFSVISNATLGSSPINIVIPSNAIPNTYEFVISVKNSTTSCVSSNQIFTVKINATPSAPTVTTPVNYCQNVPTSVLTAAASVTNTLLWYETSSVGGISSLSAPTPSSTTAGTTTYYVSQLSIDNCESARAAIDVIVNAIPAPPSATTAVAYCKNSSATALSASAIGSNSLIWYDENDNLLAAAPTPSTTSVGTQIFKVSQKSLSPANCESAKTTITVTINDLPVAPTVITPVGYCQNATASTLSATATNSNTLLWYGTSAVGGTSSGTAPTPTTTSTGTTNYYVSQKDANNCESTRAKIDIEVTPSITASILGVNAFCITGVLNNSTTLTTNPTGGNGSYTYQWQNLAGNITSATSQSYDVNSSVQSANSDTYSVTVTSGYCATTASVTVTKQGWLDIPSVSGNSPDICGSGSKTLSIVNPSGFGTYKWFADAITLTQLAAGTSFATPNLTSTTTYYVAREQQITATLTCQTARTATTVSVNASPETPTIVNSANKTNFCNSESRFSLSVSCASGNAQYRLNNGSWTNGNSVSITPSTYTSVTTLNYDFKCSLSASCESAVASTSVVVSPAPNAPSISGNTSICSGTSTTLTASGCAGTVVWSNGTIATTITVSVSGTYNATCTVNGCTSVASSTQTIVVNQNPTITLGSISSICNAATSFDLPYTATSNNPDKYSLTSTMPDFVSVSDASLPISTINVVVPSGKTGSHTFTLNLKNGSTNCTNSQIFSLTVLPVLLGGSIETSSSTINCSGYNAGVISSVNAASGGKTAYVYQWQSSTDGTNFTDISGENLATYNPPAITQTTYYRRKVTDDCGAIAYSSNVHQIQIVPDPQITITDVTDRTICSGGVLNLDAIVIGGSGTCTATWESAATQTGTYSVEQTGGLSFSKTLTNVSSTPLVRYYRVSYSCSGTGSSACNQSVSSSVKVTVNHIPNAPTVSGNSNICAGSSTTLTASGCTGTVTWSNATTGSSLSVSVAGTYSATCIESSCTSSISNIHVITVNPIPNAPTITSDDADNIVCAGKSIKLSASDCVGTVVWSNSTSASSISVSTSGTYNAVCVVNGCSSGASTTQTLVVNAIPSAPIISGNTSICSGNSTTLTASGCSGTVVWNTGVTSSTLSVSSAGTYNATCTLNGCTSVISQPQSVTVNSIPNAPIISGNTSFCAGSSTILTASGCLGVITWNTGVTGNTLSISTTGTYSATCTENLCTSAESLVQTVNSNPLPTILLGTLSSLCNAATSFDLPFTSTANNPDKYSLTSTMPDFVSVAETNLPESPITVAIPSAKTGNQNFSLTIKNSTTGCIGTQSFSINILPALIGGSIEISSSTINCSGYNAGVISSVSLASGGKTDYGYQWQSSTDGTNFTDIAGANLTTYDPSALTQTTYYRRKVSDACGAEAYSTNVHQIQIVPDPQITITDASDRTICSGGSINLAATTIGGSGTCTATWQSSTTPSGTYINEQVGGLSFTTTLTNGTTAAITKYYRAIYSCAGTGSGSCNQGTSGVVKVTINPKPNVLTVSGGGTICSGNSTTLTASTCNGSVIWSNGVTATSISVSSAGTYSAVCINSCGMSATSNEVVVNVTTITPPVVSGATTVCSGQSATLTASGCAGTVVWSNSSSGTSITVSSSTTTSYTAVCNASGCTSLSSESVTVTVAPSIDFTVGTVADLCNSATNFSLPYSLTLGSPDKYSLTSTIAGFTSVTDGNLTASPLTVTIPSGQTGTFSFTLTLKISSTGCSKSQTFAVTILPALNGGSIETSASTINCSGYNAGAISSVSLASGGKTDYVYQWQNSTNGTNFTDIAGANLTTYDPPALTQTTYYRRKVSDACGAEAFSSNVHQIQIVPDPQITITDVSDRTICSGGSINLSATTIGGSGTCTATWQSSTTPSGTYTNEQVGGLNFTATLTNSTAAAITKYYRAIYSCAGTGSSSCNQGTSAVVKMTINPIPNAPSISPASVVICPTQSTTLTASGCDGLITWNGGQTGSTLSVSEAGTYAATCSLNSCVSVLSASATVTVASGGTPVAPPVISGTATICNGQSTTLTATNCTGVVSWSNGMSGTSISVNPSITTDYTTTCFDGTCTSNSSNKITVTVNSYPVITTHPKSDADCNGNSVTFSVAASSVSSYQWQRKVPNGTFTDIANAISNTLTISNVGSSIDPNQAEYRVVLSNGTCSVTSTTAILTVNSVVGSLADQTICEGANASFNLMNVVISGNIQSYQWQQRVGTSGTWNDIAGATTTTLTINSATNADEQYYRCKVTFTAGSSSCARYTTDDDSNGAKLSVLVASTPSISGTNVVCLGKSTTLTTNNCDGAIAWSSGQTTASITISPMSNTAYTVTCTSTQCGFNVSSTPYLVTVNSTPQPEIITYDVITPATLTFAARTTFPNATLMWYNRASGGTGTTTAPSFTAVGTYSYWVTQTDPITGCESARLPIIAKVLDYFHIMQQPTNQVDCKRNSVYFGVVAVAPTSLITYQWQRKRPNEPDFVNLVEEGNGIKGWYASTMAVSNVGDANNPNQTQYRCIISSGGQVLTSEISTLTVNSLTGSMPNLGICVGGSNEFNLQNYFTIMGNVLSYQWQTRPGTSGAWTNVSDGNGISGSTSSALKFTKATYEQGVYYRCLVKFNTQGFECIEPTDAAKLIVSGFPPAPSVSNVFYCQNSSAVRLKVDSPIQNLVWYAQETGGVGITTAPTPSTNTAGIFKYYVADRTDEGCESPRVVINVEVGALPPAPKNTTPTPINEGSVLTFSAEGTPAENQVLRWYTTPTITTFSTTAPTFTAAGTYTRYVAQVSAFGCMGPRTAITATIIPSLKFTKQPLSQADCEGNSVTFSVTATAPSTFTYQWQRQKPTQTSFTDIANETSATLKISNIGSTIDPHLTKYRCIIKDDKGTTISEEAVLTVNAIVGTLPTMSLCDGKASKLSFNGLMITGTVAEYQWQKKSGNSYIDIPANTAGVAIINEIGTYRGKISFLVDKNTTCSRTTDDWKVEVKPTPIAPQVSNQNACLNTPFDITKAFTATNPLLWYESATDTTADKTLPKIDVSNVGKTTFFVSQISSFGCESERKSFDVVVSSIPEKPITESLTYCRNAPSLALTASTSSQNQVVWYASLTAKNALTPTPIPSTKLDGEMVYFVAAKNAAGCESERVPLKVSVSPCIANFTNNFNNCLQVSADSVKGNQWFDLYDTAGRLYASVNPNGQNLGKVSISIRHYGRGSAAIPATKNDTKLMARYVDFQSSILNEFPLPVSLRVYYLNEELNEYKTATNLPNLSINDFNIVHYDGVREDCGFENNDNFVEGDSYVIYKNVIGNQLTKDFFYLQFDVNAFSENGATANDFTEITFSGKETEAQTVQLNWQSKFEVKAEKYILERSADCKSFVPMAEVKANGTANLYENIDFQPLAGKSCYRLVYVDKDGTKKYLDAIEVNFTDATPICSVFPNPWNKGDEINLYLRNIKEKEIKLYDMLGNYLLFSLEKEDSKIIKIHPEVHLSKGIHFLVLVGEDGKKCVQKVVINP